MVLRGIKIKQLPYDLSGQAGLALIGKYLKRINLNALVDPAFPVQGKLGGIANSDILKSYLCLGKNDFEATECQRLDSHATSHVPRAQGKGRKT
ncbi:hypothetical protein ABE501_20765 [Comamonas testosteroni]